MKKFVFASVMALAGISLVIAPKLQAQDQGGTLSIQNPVEYNAYQLFHTQTDPKAKAPAGEDFLSKYPQSIVKNAVLQELMETYQALNDADHVLGTASRLLQVDPINFEAIYFSVAIKKSQCARTSDAQTCDDAAALAQKGLALKKPAGMADADWQRLTHGAFPIFHSAIAVDDVVSKKDFKAAQAEYTAELKLFTDQETATPGPALNDMLLLAQAYSQPGSARDLKMACWFYARVWDFAPAQFKPQIEKSLNAYYKQFHGGVDGLDALKQQAQATTFPPGTLVITPAKSPQEQIHDLLQSTNPKDLALADKETVLAMGAKEDADKLWALLQGQETQVPGTVLEANATTVKVVVTTLPGRKPDEATVTLKAPTACAALPAASDVKTAEDFVTNNGTGDDATKMTTLFTTQGAKVKKVTLQGLVPSIKVAVTQDAKTAKVADFIVNLKEPASCKDIPAVGSDFTTAPAVELVGTYDTYRQVAATATTSQAAEIVLKDGEVIPAEAKKPTPKPAAGHHPAAGHRPAH
jgi:hypothetical protein